MSFSVVYSRGGGGISFLQITLNLDAFLIWHSATLVGQNSAAVALSPLGVSFFTYEHEHQNVHYFATISGAQIQQSQSSVEDTGGRQVKY